MRHLLFSLILIFFFAKSTNILAAGRIYEPPRESKPPKIEPLPEKKVKKKKRRPSLSCEELHSSIFGDPEIDKLLLQNCIISKSSKCRRQNAAKDCFQSQSTLCLQNYFRDQHNFIVRYRKRKCWYKIEGLNNSF